VTVGPPFDLLLYKKDSMVIDRYRRVCAGDADLNSIHASWEQSLRRAVEQLPDLEFETGVATVRGCEAGKAAVGVRRTLGPEDRGEAVRKGPSTLAASGDSGKQLE
jgi:hypothetical protein